MATSAQTGDKEELMERDVRHSCSLCMERYRGRCPKILPCFHTFCLPCLMALEASVQAAASQDKTARQCDEKEDCMKEEVSGKEGTTGQGGDNSRGDGEKPVFLCPTCRAPVPVPEGGVASLQTNFYVEDEDTTTEENSPPAVCAMCEEGDQQPAVYDCHQCQMKMCRSCRRCHDKLMPKHQLTTVITASLVQPGKGTREMKANQRACAVHRDQALCFHCRQCQVSVCLHCKLTSHEGHDTVDLASAALQAKREMSLLIPSAQKQVQVLESSWQQVERDSGQLTRHGQDVKQRIEARCNALVMWATQARDQLMEEASAKEASSRNQLTAEKSSIAHLRDSLSSLLSRAVHASSADPDVIMLKNELKEALLSEEKVNHHTKRAQETEHPWGWDYDVMDASILHSDDVRAYMGCVAEGTGMGMASPPLSLKELTCRVDSWMNEVKATVTNMTSQLTSCEHGITALQKKEAELEKKMKSADDEIRATSKETEDDLRKKTEALNTDVQKTFSSLNTDISAHKMALDALQKATQSLKDKIETSGKMVSFVATDINRVATKRDATVVFSKSEVNNGGCYDNTSGRFTVSVPGCYVFTCSMGAGGDKSNVATACIVVDGSQYAYIRGSYTAVGCSSISVQLKRGQKVWVMAYSDAENYCSGELSFTGALVQPEL